VKKSFFWGVAGPVQDASLGGEGTPPTSYRSSLPPTRPLESVFLSPRIPSRFTQLTFLNEAVSYAAPPLAEVKKNNTKGNNIANTIKITMNYKKMSQDRTLPTTALEALHYFSSSQQQCVTVSVVAYCQF